MRASLLIVPHISWVLATANAAVLFHDDFDNEANASPPTGWVEQANDVGGGQAVETSASSSVTIPVLTQGTTRIVSTSTFDPSVSDLQIDTNVTAWDPSASSGTAWMLGGVTANSNFDAFFSITIDRDFRLIAQGGNVSSNVMYGLTTISGYTGGTISLSAILTETGFTVLTDHPGASATYEATYEEAFGINGFRFDQLGIAASAFLQTTGLTIPASTEFDSISISAVPEPSQIGLLTVAFGLLALRRRK